MKVDYWNLRGSWMWVLGPVRSRFYSRRRDAVRGFERHCARVRAM